MFRIPHMFRDRGMFAPGGGAPFGLSALQADSNCILIQDPSQVWGVQDFLPRRNLLLMSNSATNTTYWLATGLASVTATSSANPIDSESFYFVCAGSGVPGVLITQNSASAVAGSAYTALYYLKKDSHNFVQITFSSTTFGIGQYANIDLDAGSVSYSTGCTVSIASAGNGWYRVAYTATATTSGATGCAIVYINNGSDGRVPIGSTGGVKSILFCHLMICRADTLDQSYQKITDWTTEQYAWAAQKQVPWLRRNRFLNTATLSTQTVSSVTANPITVSFKGTGTITFSTAYSGSLVGTGANDRVTATFTPSAGNLVCTVSGTVTEAQCEVGISATDYQPIGASWDATYAALAAAAGFNTGIWQDAGTNPVNTSGQSVYRITDASGKGYTADQATAANRPLWTLDANAKPYLLGDNVNDAMPVTFPASFSSNASVYVTTDSGTTVTDGVTLNGSYAPLVEAKQYARVVFKNGRPAYHNKLVKWLNAKAGL